MPLTQDEVLAEIDKLADRKANWDSYGADPLNEASANHARSYLPVLVYLPEVVVMTRDGHVEFVWRGDDIELEFRPDGSVESGFRAVFRDDAWTINEILYHIFNGEPT